MRFAISCLLMAALSLSATGLFDQSRTEVQSTIQILQSDLLSLKISANATPSLKQHVVERLAALQEATHKPSQLTVRLFVDQCVSALAGKPIAEADAAKLAKGMQSVVQSAGRSTKDFLDGVTAFEQRLINLGVTPYQAHRVSAQLERIGMEVRGPEDTPVSVHATGKL